MEDDDRDLRRPGTVSEDVTVNERQVPGARVGEGGRRCV